jgi:transposase InsO family protein
MTAFIEEHRGEFGVEPMCRMLQIAQSTYYERRAIARDPDRASARAKSDADLCIKINAAWEENRKLYGARKIWHVLLRDNQAIARCTVERLMRNLGIKGVVRGKKVVTTNPDTSQPCPDDKVNRLFKADRPNQLWGRSLWRHWFEPNGRRLYIRPNVVGNGLCRFRHRCLCAPHCWLARIDINGNAVRS